MKIIICCVISLTMSLALSGQQSPCQNTPEYRQLDFWVGKWRVETPKGQLAGHNTIEIILDGCVVFENWEGGGSSGKSFNYYDKTSGKWHQKWINNFGQPLELEGEVIDDKIVYRGISTHPRTGQKIHNEMTLKKITADEVHQLWNQSTDEGATWNTVFDGRYLRTGTDD